MTHDDPRTTRNRYAWDGGGGQRVYRKDNNEFRMVVETSPSNLSLVLVSPPRVHLELRREVTFTPDSIFLL
jgi:hypothetical protein